MNSLFFAVKIQRLTRFIEIDENDLMSDDCQSVFFTQGKKKQYIYVFFKISIKQHTLKSYCYKNSFQCLWNQKQRRNSIGA